MSAKRRRFHRHPIRNLLYVDIGGGNGAIVLNLSENGAEVHAVSPLTANDSLACTIQLGSHKLQMNGVVAWTDTSGRAGVRFQNSPENRRAIKEYLLTNALASTVDAEPNFNPPQLNSDQSRPTEALDFARDLRHAGQTAAARSSSASLPNATSVSATSTAKEKTQQPVVAAATTQPQPARPEPAPVPVIENHNGKNLSVPESRAVRPSVTTAEPPPPSIIDQRSPFDDVAQRAQQQTRGTGAAIALSQGGIVSCCGRSGSAPDHGARLDSAASFSGRCMEGGASLRCDDTEADPRVDAIACRALEIRSIIAVPVRAEQGVVGVFEVFSNVPLAFGSGEVAYVEQLAETVAVLAGYKPARRAEDRPLPAAEADTKIEPATPVQAAPPAPATAVLKPAQPARASTTTAPATPKQATPPPAAVVEPAPAVAPSARPKPAVTTAAPAAAPPKTTQRVAPPTAVVAPAPAKTPVTVTSPVTAASAIPKPAPQPELTPEPAKVPISKPEASDASLDDQLRAMRAAARSWEQTSPEPAYMVNMRRWVWVGIAATVMLAAAGAAYRVWHGESSNASTAASTAAATQPAAAPASAAPVPETTVSVTPPPKTSSSPGSSTRPAPATGPSNVTTLRSAERADDAQTAAVATPPTIHGTAGVPLSLASAPAALPTLGAATTTAPPVSSRSGGELINRVPPVYPPDARRLSIEGDVELDIVVSTNGHVSKVRVLKGNPLLTLAAASAVHQWRYRPLLVDGKAVENHTQVSVRFRMPPKQ